ncbi:GNAT family N-acetyltransferase [Zhihengliuella flava]|uniref:GNAT superfamily N-acetyltransferase n=1 Tax=Zhihengliuella flava TaxID=1285193 RepID=A0A931DAB5_9MICC|nr:GNAT family N-acetyltransferase [Zhihengliuella flava]MBG6085357.1 GNAT superfamily N-acetyltransferase [Zhihengliuella flava]
MELESGTRAIVALAWARRLGLPDDALQKAAMGADAVRVHVPVDDGSLLLLRYLTGSVLAGPEWALDALEGYDDEALAGESALVRALRATGRSEAEGLRTAGDYTLYYLDEPAGVEPSEQVAVSADPAYAQRLVASCPSDDTIGLDLARGEHMFTLVADEQQLPVATASYGLWEGLLADLATLTLPDVRRHGLGAYITAVAADDALTQGFTPQWRAPRSSAAAHRLAEDVGFVSVGSLTSARLT